MLNMQPAGSVLSVMEFNLCVGLLFYFALLFCVSFNVVCVFILLEFLMNKDVYTVYIFWQETSIVRVLIFVRLATWYDSSSDGTSSTWYEQSRYPIIAPLALHNEQIEAQLGERGGGEACFAVATNHTDVNISGCMLQLDMIYVHVGRWLGCFVVEVTLYRIQTDNV